MNQNSIMIFTTYAYFAIPYYAEAFVEPFNELLLLEEDEDGDQSPWLDKGNHR